MLIRETYWAAISGKLFVGSSFKTIQGWGFDQVNFIKVNNITFLIKLCISLFVSKQKN